MTVATQSLADFFNAIKNEEVSSDWFKVTVQYPVVYRNRNYLGSYFLLATLNRRMIIVHQTWRP